MMSTIEHFSDFLGGEASYWKQWSIRVEHFIGETSA